MQRLHERSTRGTFIHDAVSWMHLVHRLYYRINCTDSSYPLIVMVQSTQYRNSNYLAPYMMRGMRRSARFGKLLPNPLMRSCLVEVRHILIEHALQLLLVEDEQVVKAFLSHTPQEAFADRIGARSVIRCSKHFNGTHCRHASKARPKFVIIITYQILRRLPIRGSFSQRYARPRHQ